jgi:hypothetical protein
MGCPSCIIIGDAPPSVAIRQRINELPPQFAAKFEEIDNLYNTDPSAVTADQACFIFFLEMYLVQITAT